MGGESSRLTGRAALQKVVTLQVAMNSNNNALFTCACLPATAVGRRRCRRRRLPPARPPLRNPGIRLRSCCRPKSNSV